MDTGRYIIANIKFGAVVVLHDDNEDSDIIAGTPGNHPGEKWNITLLPNQRYLIQSHPFGTFASSPVGLPQVGEYVMGRRVERQWAIRETNISGRYLIESYDGLVYWGLSGGKDGTPVTLTDSPYDLENQWAFSPDSESEGMVATSIAATDGHDKPSILKHLQITDDIGLATTNIMTPLDTGNYIITNVRYRQMVVVPDGNLCSPIVAGGGGGTIWNIELLKNNLYSIKNDLYKLHASSNAYPSLGGEIFGHDRIRQWRIKELQTKGRYVILPAEAQLYWSLEDAEFDTPLSLDAVPFNKKNQWTFTEILSMEMAYYSDMVATNSSVGASPLQMIPNRVYHMDVTLEELYSGSTRHIALEQCVNCLKCHQGPEHLDALAEVVFLDVQIIKGMKRGERLTFKDMIHHSCNCGPEDATIVIHEKLHDQFKRLGNNLLMELEIDQQMAMAGGEFVIQHLDQHPLALKLEPMEAEFFCRYDGVKIIHGQGLPYRDDRHGDLYVKFIIKASNPISRISSAVPAAPLKSGTYRIQHMETFNFATIHNDDDRTPLVAGVGVDSEHNKWRVRQLPNCKYDIVSDDYRDLYLTRRARAKPGEQIWGSRDHTPTRYWSLDARANGYIIFTTDKDLFWNIEDGEQGTMVTLADRKSVWRFI